MKRLPILLVSFVAGCGSSASVSGNVTYNGSPVADGYIRFEHTFDVEGTYDYFSLTHEVLGMVGRVIVGRPGGPGEKEPGYGAREGRAPMYPPAAALLEAAASAAIVEKKVLPYPRDLVVRPYPFGQR